MRFKIYFQNYKEKIKGVKKSHSPYGVPNCHQGTTQYSPECAGGSRRNCHYQEAMHIIQTVDHESECQHNTQ